MCHKVWQHGLFFKISVEKLVLKAYFCAFIDVHKYQDLCYQDKPFNFIWWSFSKQIVFDSLLIKPC